MKTFTVTVYVSGPDNLTEEEAKEQVKTAIMIANDDAYDSTRELPEGDAEDAERFLELDFIVP